ncbi:MAG: hydrolase [Oscillospiraceae bacterium]
MSQKEPKKQIPSISGTLRAHALKVPDSVYAASGIVVLGRRIKSVVFSTDIAIIRNCNADAVLAVYPFTPQQTITRSIITSAPIPVFCGVGGAITTGHRSVLMAVDAEADGAFGVVVNAATRNDTIRFVSHSIDIPLIVTVVGEKDDVGARLEAGASIINVSAAAKTPEVVKKIRTQFPNVPIIATGGTTDESIMRTIKAGANCISWTPPSTAEIFAGMMTDFRENLDPEDTKKKTEDPLMDAVKELL